MTERSTPRRQKPGELDVDRLMTRIEAGQASLRERLEGGFDNIEARLKRIENDVAAGQMGQSGLRNEIAETRLALHETRDAALLIRDDLDRHIKAESQIRAGETVALATMQVASTQKVLGGLSKNQRLTGYTLAGLACIGLGWLGANGPNIVKGARAVGHGFLAFWTALGG